MNFTKQIKDQQILLTFKGDLSIYEVSKIQKEMISSLNKYNSMVIDLKEVDNCDTAGIQLLCSIKNTADNKKKLFLIENPSNSVIEAFKRIGLNLGNYFSATKEV